MSLDQEHLFEPATKADMPFIERCIRNFRLDDENLEAEQFIVVTPRSSPIPFPSPQASCRQKAPSRGLRTPPLRRRVQVSQASFSPLSHALIG